MDETNDDMPVPVDPRDAEIAALKQGAEERNSYIEMLEQQGRATSAMLDGKDAEIAELTAKLALAEAAIEAHNAGRAKLKAALDAASSSLPTGGIHVASTLAGGNVDHPPRTRDEGRIHVADQY